MKNRERLNISWKIKRAVENGESKSPLTVHEAREQFENFCNRETELHKNTQLKS